MKLLGVALASLGFASAASVTKKVSYDDWKVYRVNVGSNAAKFGDVMSRLQLETWKGKPASSDVVDVMVPPSQIADFESSTAGIETRVMHENLGLSIADEQSFGVYAGRKLLDKQMLHTTDQHLSWPCSKRHLVQLLPLNC